MALFPIPTAVYSFIRRQGHDAHAAQDLTQGFFSGLLERDHLRTVDRDKGRFRSFLITAVKWHLTNEWDRATAEKRGGRVQTFSLDETDAENRFLHEPRSDDGDSPERAFDRQWARLVFEQALGRLKEEYRADGREIAFDKLSGAMLDTRDAEPYARIGEALGLSEGGVKSAVRRMRQRCGELFREQISQTVADPTVVDDEIRYLLSLLAAG